MGYREDKEALRNRSVQLEQELAAVEEKLRRVRGDGARIPIFMGLSPFELRRHVGGRLTEEGFASLRRMIDERMPEGTVVERRGSTLRWEYRGLSTVIKRGGGRGTLITMTEDRSRQGWSMRALVAMGVFFAMSFAVGISGWSEGPFAVILPLSAMALAVLFIIVDQRRQRRQWVGVFESAVLLAEVHCVATTPPDRKTRRAKHLKRAGKGGRVATAAQRVAYEESAEREAEAEREAAAALEDEADDAVDRTVTG